MPEPSMEHYEEFRREVDEVLARQEPLPEFDALASIRKAVSGFDAWWQGEHPAGSEAPSAIPAQVQELSASLEHARREIQALKASMLAQTPAPQMDTAAMTLRDQVRALSSDKEALERKVDELRKENDDLLKTIVGVQAQMEETRGALARVQEGYGAHMLRLEENARIQNERIAALAKDKEFIESQSAKLNALAAALQKDLESSRGAAAAAVKENAGLQGKLSEGERTIASLQMQRTAMEAALNEVRAHAGALQERILRGRQVLEDELSEGRRGLEEAVKLGKEVRQGLDSQRVESERRLSETAHFLEVRLKAIQDEAADHYAEVRDMLDMLSREREQGKP
ncbi:MAG: hypothetical protein AAB576_07230 [Elusimicrobiota bacterium]